MTIAIGDIIEITATYANAVAGKASTVHHYEAQTDSYLIEAYIDAWHETVWGEMKAVITSDWSLIEVTARNLFSETTAATKGYAEPGTSSGETMPPFVAYSVKLNHDNPGAIRPGSKRLPGVDESASGANGEMFGLTYAGFASNVAALADPLTEAVGGLIELARPVVVKRVAEIVSGVTRYRLPVSLAEKIIGYVYEAVLNRFVSSQVTRKRGRGE